MVGVPGKSKGCSTCRRRKKGCDQKRPSCGQCIASGYVCGGYQRDLTFIPHPTTKAAEKAHFLPVKPAPPLITLLPSLDRAAVIAQCRSIFFDIYLPHGKCAVRDDAILRSKFPMVWVEVLPDYGGDEMALDLAFSALSISRVGRTNNDPRLVKESNKMYGKALKGLQRALYDSNRMRSDQVLAACNTLGLYERFEAADTRAVGWVSHSEGAARIIQLRGPPAHSTGSSHHLFVGSRVHIIYAALLRRKKTFLEDEEWLTVPWFEVRRTGMDRLVDITTRVPGLLERIDTVRSSMQSIPQRDSLLECIDQCRAMQQSLTSWMRWRINTSIPIIVKHESMGDSDTYPFEHDITFNNHLFLGSNLLLWTCHLIVSTTISELQLLLANLGYHPIDMLQSTTLVQQEARQYATSIAQSIPYALWPEMGDVGVNIISYPMFVAFNFFLKSNEIKICAWLIRICNEMKNTGLRLVFPDSLTNQFVTTDDVSGNSSIPRSAETEIRHKFDFNRPISNKESIATLNSLKPELSMTPDTSHTGAQCVNPSSEQQIQELEDSEDDANYEMDSDLGIDAESPTSGNSHSSSSNSRRGNTPGLNVSKHLSQLQVINASKGEFTFVAEDPSGHYIISEQEK